MKKAKWAIRKFWKPNKMVEFDGFKCGNSYCVFTSFYNKEVGDGVEVPMQSGKTALCRIYETETPHDPGDQHFYKIEFVKYL